MTYNRRWEWVEDKMDGRDELTRSEKRLRNMSIVALGLIGALIMLLFFALYALVAR
jgi:hypothetical protein